jgi:hypothetical protein
VDYAVLNMNELPYDSNSHELEGYQYGGVNISLIFVDMPPGDGPRLHLHPYAEVFVRHEARIEHDAQAPPAGRRAGSLSP